MLKLLFSGILLITMYQASASSKAKIRDLANEYIHPGDVDQAMRMNLFSQLRVQEKTIARNGLNRLSQIGTNDVVNTARKMVKQIRNNRATIEDKLVKFMMKMKIDDAEKELDKAKKAADDDKKYLDKIVCPGTIAREHYNEIIKEERERNWNKKQKKMKNKISLLKEKRKKENNKDSNVPEYYKGIKIGDNVLNDVDDVEVRLHDVDDINENEKAIMKMNPDDRVYERVTVSIGEQNVKECFTKMR